jgi:Lar family restriction alleviation protein
MKPWFIRDGIVTPASCPFCGGKPTYVCKVQPIKKIMSIGYIACRKCGVRTGVNTFGRVLKVWNRRAIDQALRESKRDGGI